MAESFLDHPADWTVVTLDANPTSSKFFERVESGGTPSTTVDEYWDGDIPWLTPKEITRNGAGIYVSSTERNITAAGMRGSAAKLMPAGTVMLTKRAPVGAVLYRPFQCARTRAFSTSSAVKNCFRRSLPIGL